MMVALSALDVRNPVAFLAALGALRLASDGAETPITLHWERCSGTWTAVCSGESIGDPEALIATVACGHEMRDLDAELGWESDIMKLDRDEVRRLLVERLPNEEPARATLWPAAVVAACLSELPTVPSTGNVPYTPLRLIPYRGRAQFLTSTRRLSESGRLQDDLRSALFEPWRYSKGVNRLSWDPGATLSARAYTAQAPTDFGPLGVAGVMLLAVAALPLFPLLPATRGTSCRGFGMKRDRFIWPVWNQPASIRAVRVLLGMPMLAQDVKPDEQLLARHGIAMRMEAQVSRFGAEGRVLGWGRPTVIASDASITTAAS
jgi:CRISPR-associated endonuclease/helicase Cas3